MSGPIDLVRLLAPLMFALMLSSACAPPEPAQRPGPSIAAPAAVASVASRSDLDAEQARARADALVQTLQLGEYGNDDDVRRRAASLGLDEALARRLVTALTRTCLEAKDATAKACSRFDILEGRPDATLDALIAFLGETGDPRGPTPTARLLVRLHTAGSVGAKMALDELLDRRMTSSYPVCAPPSAAEIAASAASLADFVVVEASPSQTGGAASLVPRSPRPGELADLAYFYASIAGAEAPVGSLEEDAAAPALEEGAEPLGARERLRVAMHEALATGALDDHAWLARRYLESLGFPNRIRLHEERDARWGGGGYAYVMRDLALTLELLGRPREAEALYRRANPGGGACGTSVESVRRTQIEGVIRTAEAGRGCRAVVAERLFSVALDLRKSYGTRRLTEAGFDVARLYRGALLTLGRRDAAALATAFATDARLGPAARARLDRLGPEDWATRTRAIAGHAAESKKASISDLIAIARRGPTADRINAIEVIGELIEDHGYDACVGFIGWGSFSSRMERDVPSLMHACDTRLTTAEADKVVDDLAPLARSSDPELRAALAATLGRAGRPRSRSALAALARDTFTRGGELCRTDAAGVSRCGPNRPVRQAAEDAIARLDETEKRRAEERARALETPARDRLDSLRALRALVRRNR